MGRFLDLQSAAGKLVAGRLSDYFEISSPDFIEASDTLVTALWPALPEHMKSGQAEWLEVLRLAHELNTERNKALLAQIEAVALCLNAIGVQPLLLKGASHLATDLWPTIGSRLLGDIDILVPKARLDESFLALQVLAARGTQDPGNPELTAQHKHLAPIVGAGGSAAVEVHHSILPAWAGNILAAEGVLSRSSEHRLGRGIVRIPSSADRVLIAMLHGPIGTGTYFAPLLQLRDLLDINFLAARYGNEIDWKSIEQRLGAARWPAALEITNRALLRFTGMPAPFPSGTYTVRLDAARWFWQLEHPLLVRLGWAVNLARFTLRSFALGGALRKRALRYLAQPETYRRAFRRYIQGSPE